MVAVGFVGSGVRQLLDEGVAFFPGFAGFLEAMLAPEEGAPGNPVVGVEANGFPGFHALPPEACADGVVLQIGLAEDKRSA